MENAPLHFQSDCVLEGWYPVEECRGHQFIPELIQLLRRQPKQCYSSHVKIAFLSLRVIPLEQFRPEVH